MDPRLHQLQGETEVRPSATLSLLQELYRERLALFDRHVKGAQAVAASDR